MKLARTPITKLLEKGFVKLGLSSYLARSLVDSLWRDDNEIVKQLITEMITENNAALAPVLAGGFKESYLVNGVTDAALTQLSSWFVLQPNELVGNFKVVVMVRDKVTDEVFTLQNVFTFDYTDALAEVDDDNAVITAAPLALALGIDGNKQLYAALSSMPENEKRIHFCFERCIVSSVMLDLAGTMDMQLGAEGELEMMLELGGTAAMSLGMEGELANEWDLLLEFETNSPGTTTFDPSISAFSGDYKWDVGGTEVLGTSVSMILDGSSTNVKLYGKNTPLIENIDFKNDHIVGILDLSHAAFKEVGSIDIFTNYGLTGIIIHPLHDGLVYYLNIGRTGITGNLDISMLKSFDTSAYIGITDNSALTGVIMPTNINIGENIIQRVTISNNGLTQTELDLTMFDFSDEAEISITKNSNVESLVFSNTSINTLSIFDIGLNKLTGVLDLSMIKSFSSMYSHFSISKEYLLTSVLFDDAITTGRLNNFILTELGLTGTLDLTGIKCSLYQKFDINLCPTLTNILFHNNYTSNVSILNISNNGISSALDLSGFKSWSQATIKANTSLPEIIFPLDFSGSAFTLEISSNSSLNQDLDLSGILFANGSQISIFSNTILPSITFPTITPTGKIAILKIYSNNLSSLDLSCFTNMTSAPAYSRSSLMEIKLEANLTSLTLPVMTEGGIQTLNMNGLGLSGSIDLTSLIFNDNNIVNFYNNANVTSIILPNKDKISQLAILNCNLTGNIDLSGTTSLYTLDISGNTNLTGINLTDVGPSFISISIRNTAIGYIDLTGLVTDYSYRNYYLDNVGWTADIVNHVLSDLDANSTSGYTNRVIYIAGTNAAPDGSSGGYDGLTAKASLQAKGFTVNTN